jgi:DNA oxidative demethylase
LNGFHHLPGFFSLEQQRELLSSCRAIARVSPLFTPVMPGSGAKFNYQMTNCGDWGWISDIKGYRYTREHPVTGEPWAAIPEIIRTSAMNLAEAYGYSLLPQTCLINYYPAGGKLGLHQDNSEKNQTAPIISFSLGDDAVFLIGGLRRSDPTKEIVLRSGDALIMGGEARMAFHGVKKILPKTSNFLRHGGRINLTIREYL